MLVTNYYTVLGQIIGERVDSGSRTNYGLDALGSVVSTIVDNTVQRSYAYKPYGADLSANGTGADPECRWVGSYGYRRTNRQFASEYIRARTYSTETGMWTSADANWPAEKTYVFSHYSPLNRIDFGGMASDALGSRCATRRV